MLLSGRFSIEQQIGVIQEMLENQITKTEEIFKKIKNGFHRQKKMWSYKWN